MYATSILIYFNLRGKKKTGKSMSIEVKVNILLSQLELLRCALKAFQVFLKMQLSSTACKRFCCSPRYFLNQRFWITPSWQMDLSTQLWATIDALVCFGVVLVFFFVLYVFVAFTFWSFTVKAYALRLKILSAVVPLDTVKVRFEFISILLEEAFL